MRLFLEHGFGETTIDDIARHAGVSRRSVFRYFGSKEDIVLGALNGRGESARAALEARPAAEPPWTALREALREVDIDEHSESTLRIAKMMYDTPSLRARSMEKHLHWQRALVPNIRVRLGVAPEDEDDPRAEAIVACAITCLDIAGEKWANSDGQLSLVTLYDATLAAVTGTTFGDNN